MASDLDPQLEAGDTASENSRAGTWLRSANIAARRTLKLATVGILAVVILIVALGVGFFATPVLKLSSLRLQKALARFGPEKLDVDWRDASLTLTRTTTFGKDVVLDLHGVCVRWNGDGVDACFERFQWGFGFDLEGIRARVTRYLPLIATGGRIRGDLAKLKDDPPEPTEKKESGGFDAVDFLRTRFLPKWQINGSLVEVSSLVFGAGERTINGGLLLETAETFQVSPMSAAADFRKSRVVRAGPGDSLLRLTLFNLDIGDRTHFDGQVHVLWPTRLEGAWQVVAAMRASLADRGEVHADFESRIRRWDDADFKVNAAIGSIAPLRDLRIDGRYRGDVIDGRIGAKLGGIGSRVKSLDLVDCDTVVNLQRSEGSLVCGPETIDLVLTESGPIRRKDLFRLRPKFELRVANFNWGDAENGERSPSADWSFVLDLRHLGFLELAVNLAGRVARPSTGDQGPKLTYSVDGGVSIRITDFKRLSGFLERTPYAAPAPLNQLGGPIEARVEAAISESGGGVPFELQTRLSSANQKLDVTTKGLARLIRRAEGGFRPSVEANVTVNDVLIALPRLELRAPPRVLPDRRFRNGLAQEPPGKLKPKKSAPPLDFDVRVATAAPGRIRIATSLTKAPIPITIDYRTRTVGTPEREPSVPADVLRSPASSQVGQSQGTTSASTVSAVAPTPKTGAAAAQRPESASETRAADVRIVSGGTVILGRTPIDLLRRQAFLERLILRMEPDGDQRLDGRIFVDYPEYDITILLLGTSKQPVVRFESDPPLDQDQILSVLLFGKPIGELEQGQQQSVSQLNTALADAVLGFGSLYFLASSPVQSIGYNPETGALSATVGIGSGTSLELGRAAGGGPNVGLRRRIARNWVLNTYVEESALSDQTLVSAFVEWIKRF